MDEKATFKIGESLYELVSTQDMDFEEARIVKRLTGAGLGSFELGILDGDPDAWFAQVFIALRRTNPRITEQQVNELLSGQKLVAIYRSLKEPEGDEPSPPASPPSSDADGSKTEPSDDAS
jgi:hypothetical protein